MQVVTGEGRRTVMMRGYMGVRDEVGRAGGGEGEDASGVYRTC